MSGESVKGYDEDITIRGKMDIEDIARRQVDRVLSSAYEPDPVMFESCVLALLDLLPQHQRNIVLANEKKYKEKDEYYVYDKYWCGKPLSSSKRLVKDTVINYHKLHRIVLDAYQESGLTWQIEPVLVEKGKVPDKKKTEPTPVFKETEE